MRTFRCCNPACPTKEFDSNFPACPACKADARNPRYRSIIVELVTIHFAPPDPIVPIMITGFIACQPSKAVGGQTVATPEHRVVTCKACKATEAFRKDCPDLDEAPEPLPADGELNAEVLVTPGGVKPVPA
jgi:hypothetical protein